MSLMGDYYNAVSLMKKDRMDRYAIDYANWQQGEANRSKMIGTAVGIGIGALTGGLGGLPFLGIGAGAGGALAGAGLSMIPGGLAMGTMQRAGTVTPTDTGSSGSIVDKTGNNSYGLKGLADTYPINKALEPDTWLNPNWEDVEGNTNWNSIPENFWKKRSTDNIYRYQ